jgi:hypothetical protein
LLFRFPKLAHFSVPVDSSLERFLIERGERVLRVHSTLMSASRRQARGRGKSDSIDALAVARAALREGLETLPAAHLDGPELDLRLLVDHRERLVRQRVAINNTLRDVTPLSYDGLVELGQRHIGQPRQQPLAAVDLDVHDEPGARYGRRSSSRRAQNEPISSRPTLTSPRSIDSSIRRRAVAAARWLLNPRRHDCVPSDCRKMKRQRVPAAVS